MKGSSTIVLSLGLAALGAWLAAGCSGRRQVPSREPKDQPPASIRLTSSAFADGQAIPAKHTDDGQDVSAPLEWSDPPAGTRQLALIVDDPDAPAGTWVHWVLYRIPAGTTSLPEGAGAKGRQGALAGGMVQGRNSWGSSDWRGPAPPSGMHHYHFTLYALDVELDSPAGLTKAQLLQAIKDHVLGEGRLIGTYRR